MKRLALVVVATVLSLTGCGPRSEAPHREAPLVAVATLMSHPSLDAVEKGIGQGLAESGLKEGVDYRLVRRNANGDPQLTPTIASELAAQNPKVFVAITTPMAQAAKARWRGPLIFAAVTDPVGAGLVKSMAGDPLVSGTSDAWPYEAQLRLIRRIQPDARRLAVLYNPGEAASQYGIGEIRRLAPSLGFEVIEVPVNNTSEVAAAAAQAARRADALFLSSDNTVIAGVGAAVQVAIRLKKPLYVGDAGTVERGGLAAVSVGYEALGVETGKLVARSLRGEQGLPVIVGRDQDIVINLEAAERMGVVIPADVRAAAVKTYTTIAR